MVYVFIGVIHIGPLLLNQRCNLIGLRVSFMQFGENRA
jgi:hypothetical protein